MVICSGYMMNGQSRGFGKPMIAKDDVKRKLPSILG